MYGTPFQFQDIKTRAGGRYHDFSVLAQMRGFLLWAWAERGLRLVDLNAIYDRNSFSAGQDARMAFIEKLRTSDLLEADPAFSGCVRLTGKGLRAYEQVVRELGLGATVFTKLGRIRVCHQEGVEPARLVHPLMEDMAGLAFVPGRNSVGRIPDAITGPMPSLHNGLYDLDLTLARYERSASSAMQ